MPKINRAIVSVTDKTGVVDFCKGLSAMGVEILSTGGTAKALRDACIPVIEVSDYTGSPEVMDGRLKTIHPMIEGGILGIRNNPSHQKDMAKLGIKPIDLVVVNLYEFEKTANKPGIHLDEVVEQIDIGGPTMLRAAAKNYKDVTVVVDVADYSKVLKEMLDHAGSVSEKTNFELAIKVLQTTARYDAIISNYLWNYSVGATGRSPDDPYAPLMTLPFEKIQSLRYGENPHQKAAYYKEPLPPKGTLATAKQLHGKELSYNNILDTDAALQLVAEFKDPACVIIKHTNPCGAALGQNLAEAFIRARDGDPVSSFGGIIAVNRPIDLETATAIGETFFECIVAPGYTPEALAILQFKKNLRLLEIAEMPKSSAAHLMYRRVGGGLLVQDSDAKTVDLSQCTVPTKRKPTADELAELDFAWKIVKHVKSNAIVYTKNRQLLGAGAGQMSRVDSVKIGAMKSRQALTGAVVASDAFFPFRDGVDEAVKQGITAVIQPGGSVKDAEVIAAADEQNIAMVFTGVRHFRH